MKTTVKCTTESGVWFTATSNLSVERAHDYYIGRRVSVGDGGNDTMERVVKVETLY